MIFDTIKNKESYKELENIYSALNEFSGITEDTFPDKQIILIKDKLFINPVCFETKPSRYFQVPYSFPYFL